MVRAQRIGFVTAVEIGAACIDTIAELGGWLELVVTLDDATDPSKSGRADIAALANDLGFASTKVSHINARQAIAAVEAARLDWLFVIGWSQIVGPEMFATLARGAIGAHPTLLPTGRGRAPIPWTILKGLAETGVTFFVMDEGVDTGPIVAQDHFAVAPDETATTLYAKVTQSHRRVMRDLWPRLLAGDVTAQPQDDSLASYWPKRTPEDGEIRAAMTLVEVDRLVRATTRPYPGAFISAPGGRTTIWAGHTEKPATPALAIELTDGTYWATDYEARD